MKKYIAVSIIIIIIGLYYLYLPLLNPVNNQHKNDVKRNLMEFVKKKPYTILYFWVSWCGFSKDGLINDYCLNYSSLNNDTVQSILIVVSDTSSINSFMNNNNISTPYFCLHEDKYPLAIRNVKDGNSMDDFIFDVFAYRNEVKYVFPTVLLVDSTSSVITWSTKTKYAVGNYRFDAKQKKHKLE